MLKNVENAPFEVFDPQPDFINISPVPIEGATDAALKMAFWVQKQEQLGIIIRPITLRRDK